MGVLLLPEAAAGNVQVVELAVQDGDDRHEILVINIEPWPHGPVGIRVGEDRESFRFPFRRDRETRFVAWEEIMLRNDAARRATYLKLMELSEPQKKVVFVGPMETRKSGETYSLRIPAGRGHGWLRRPIASDHVVLNLDCHAIANALWLELDRIPREDGSIEDFLLDVNQRVLAQEAVNNRETRPLAVPFEMIDAVWDDASLDKTVNISLSATVVWDRGRWGLERR